MKTKITLVLFFILGTSLLSAQTVTNTNDSGAGSLRQAIIDANTNTGTDNINFNIPDTGPHSIQLLSALPEITDPVIINGYTQPGALPASATSDAVLMIELDGSNAGEGVIGLKISGGSSTVKGLIINRFQGDGIELSINGGNLIEGNLIGTDVTGTVNQGNLGTGINIVSGDSNLIGSSTPSQRNILSGNRYGISIFGGADNMIIGNYIGTNISGTARLGNTYYGIYVQALNTRIGGTTSGEGNVISGNSYISGFNRLGAGILISGADGVIIQGNFIGTDATGTVSIGNDNGIALYSGENILIGGTEPAMKNIISGNYSGIKIKSSDQTNSNRIFGNYIGTDVSGTQGLSNSTGIELDYCSYNTIGGTGTGEGNLISGNGKGIWLNNTLNMSSAIGRSNAIVGNLIGTNASGTEAIGNGTGIYFSKRMEETMIGGTSAEARNVISGNGIGIYIHHRQNYVKGNYIGVDINGTGPLGNTTAGIYIHGYYGGAEENIIGGTEAGSGNVIAYNGIGIRLVENETYGDPKYNAFLGNSIYDNVGLGIDLGTEGVTANDAGDSDEGTNDQQNYPVLSSVESDATSTTIEGALNSTPESQFRLEFFSNTSADPSGYGEGETYLGSADVTTDASGNASFNVTLVNSIPQGSFITSTATSPDNSTSEFSEAKTSLLSANEVDAINDNISTNEDYPVTIDVLSNDSDLSGTELTIVSVSQGNSGSTTINGGTTVTYSPNPEFNGTDFFTYTIQNGNGHEDVAIVNVMVVSIEDIPIASDDYANTVSGFAIDIDALQNDSDGDQDPLTVQSVTQGVHGTVTINADNTIHYDAYADSEGTDIFTYTINDGKGNTATATVTVTILEPIPKTFVVNTTGDEDDINPGDGTAEDINGNTSLRSAIQEANAIPGTKDIIHFDIQGTGPHTIQPLSTLPEITDQVVINGYTQPGALPASATSDAVLMIELDGSNAGEGVIGLKISGGSSTVKGLIINRFQGDGIELSINGGNLIEGNLIGTDVTGTVNQGNLGTGINIVSGDSNLIGSSTPSQRNILSGNRYGISIFGGADNMIIGNYIGTNISGTARLGNTYYGIYVQALNTRIGGTTSGEGNVISGNSYISGFNRLGAGILISGADGVIIQGNFIGTDATGTVSIGNDNGIALYSGENILIGGTEPAMKNIISGNYSGIKIKSSDQTNSNRIFGNYIGTDVSGTQGLSNSTGIELDYCSYNTIGGTGTGEGNLISGNGKGIWLNNTLNMSSAIGRSNAIVGNLIGTNASGTEAIGNGTGIYFSKRMEETMIGGTSAEARNVISGNGIGIYIHHRQNYVKGNYIGVDINGTGPLGNTTAGIYIHGYYGGAEENIIGGTEAGSGNVIAYNGIGIRLVENETYGDPKYNAFLGNSIYDNVGLGIDLGTEGVTANDAGDSDEGTNDQQNYPVLSSVESDATSTTIEGALNSTPESQFRLEFFSNTSADPSGYGEGETYLGSADVTTDASGNASFNVTLVNSIPQGSFITSTATSPDNSTSEFSEAIEAVSIHTVYIPDPNFEQALIDLEIDSDGIINQMILKTDAEAVTGQLYVTSKNISDLTGIEAFVNLTGLFCYENQLTEIDISQNTALVSFSCHTNLLTSLDVSQNIALTSIVCADNQLSSLDVSNNILLEVLTIRRNDLTSIDLTSNTLLKRLFCETNQITALDLNNNTLLETLFCSQNELTTLDLSSNSQLDWLVVSSNSLTELDVSQNTLLTGLFCYNNQITSIDVINNPLIYRMNIGRNLISTLDVSQNPALEMLLCNSNLLTSLDVRNGNNTNLNNFNASNNNLTCINVDDETADHSGWITDTGVIFSNDCSYNTQLGNNVLVPLVGGFGTIVQYETVTESGNTTLETGTVGPEIPSGFSFGEPINYFNIETTASFTGAIQIVIYFGNMTYNQEDALRILHYENDQWVDVTTMVDFNDNVIYGEVSSLSSFVVVEDIGPPIFFGVPIDITVECDAIPNPASVTAEDNVDGNVPVTILETERLSTECPQEKIITRTWTATDAAGNTASATQIITVVDNTPPVITCPADVTIECDASTDPSSTGSAVATDNCDPDMVVSYNDNVAQGACPQESTITRTWTAIDACGNASTCLQEIKVVDTTPPVIICPADVTIECDASTDPSSTGSAVATDNCNNAVVVTYNDVINDGSCPQEQTIKRTWTATDACGNSSTCVQIINIVDTSSPSITGLPSNPLIVPNELSLCGATVEFLGISAFDNCVGEVIPFIDPPSGSFFDIGSTPVIVTASDGCGNTSTTSFVVEVTNIPLDEPVISPLLDPMPINSIINMTATSSDDNLQSATWTWDEVVPTIPNGTIINGRPETEILGSHIYSETGVYTIQLSVDECGDASTSSIYQYVVIYDPSAGFVTGGGWIYSPQGAYLADLLLEGKANFGFVSKYKKGTTVPIGNSEFQFKAGDLNFNSYVYDWLVIAGSMAKFKGEGTINGTGAYGFMISAIDGDLKDIGKEDKFRIKIWDKANDEVVYDNQMSEDDDANPTTEIGAGSIVIHSGPKLKSSLIAPVGDDLETLSEIDIYPNPFSNTAYIEFQHEKSIELMINVYDISGKLIENLYEGRIEEGVRYTFEYKPEGELNNGMYIVKFVLDNESVITKQLILLK